MKRKKKSVTMPLKSIGTNLSSFPFINRISSLAKKVDITIFMKNKADNLLPTILKNLEQVEYFSYLADFLMTIPQRELKSAATVATPRLDINTLNWFYPTSVCLTHCLIRRMMKKQSVITANVPIIIRAFLLYYLLLGMFFQLISVGSTIYSTCLLSKSRTLTGNQNTRITFVTTGFWIIPVSLDQLAFSICFDCFNGGIMG